MSLRTIGAQVARRAQVLRRSSLSRRDLSHEAQTTNSGAATKQLQLARQNLGSLVNGRRVDELMDTMSSVRRAFLALPKLEQQQAASQILKHNEASFVHMLKTISGRQRKSDAHFVLQLLRDSKAIYGVELSSETLLIGLDSLVHAGEVIKADAYLRSLYKNKTGLSPGPDHWYIVMEGFAETGNVKALRSCLDFMLSRWPFPQSTHYRLLLETVADNQKHVSTQQVQAIVDEMLDYRFPFDEGIQSVLTELSQRNSSLQKLPFQYEKISKSGEHMSQEQIDRWVSELGKARLSGKHQFDARLRHLRAAGFRPSGLALGRYVELNNVSSVTEFQYIRDRLGVPIDVSSRGLTHCIKNIIVKHGWEQALKAYNSSVAEGLIPTTAMVEPIIRSMTSLPLKKMSTYVVDEVIRLFNDVSDTAEWRICNSVLKAVASAEDTTKYFSEALRVLDHMRSKGLKIDAMTATGIAILLIRSSSNFKEAAETYKRVQSIVDSTLDQKGFKAILHAFCAIEARSAPLTVDPENSLEYDGMRLSIPPASAYFAIVQDMRERGYESASEYTILLGRYAKLATRAQSMIDAKRRMATLQAIKGDIDETHRRIAVDAGFELDRIVLSQLMDAYNRVGALSDAMRVWTLILTSGQISHAAVSVAFDTCGHGQSASRAFAVFEDVKRIGFTLNAGNWNAWLECLCRLELLGEVERVVKVELPAHGIELDEETKRMLVSFLTERRRDWTLDIGSCEEPSS